MHDTGELEDILKSPLENDRNENTIAHLAAEGGHVTVFKVSVGYKQFQLSPHAITFWSFRLHFPRLMGQTCLRF